MEFVDYLYQCDVGGLSTSDARKLLERIITTVEEGEPAASRSGDDVTSTKETAPVASMATYRR